MTSGKTSMRVQEGRVGLDGLCSVLRPLQHSIGYMGDGQSWSSVVSKPWRSVSARLLTGSCKRWDYRNQDPLSSECTDHSSIRTIVLTRFTREYNTIHSFRCSEVAEVIWRSPEVFAVQNESRAKLYRTLPLALRGLQFQFSTLEWKSNSRIKQS